MEKKFVVAYQAFEGALQIFGPFDTKEVAREWMQQDYKEACNKYPNDTMFEAEDSCSLEHVGDNYPNDDDCSLEEYAEWSIVELEPAK